MNIFNKTPKPVHDLRKVEKSTIDSKLLAITPYLLIIMVSILFFLAIMAFGHVFATEANSYYYFKV